MTRPFQRGDLVRHRKTGRIGHVRLIHEWRKGGAQTLSVDMVGGGPSLGDHGYEWEHYDPDALARPIRRLLACIAMAAMAKQAVKQ